MGRRTLKGGTTYLRSCDDVGAMQAFRTGQHVAGVKTNASDFRFYHRVKNNLTYEKDGSVVGSDKWPRWLRQSKEVAAYSEPEYEAECCLRLEPLVKFDIRKNKTRRGDKKKSTACARNMRKVDSEKEVGQSMFVRALSGTCLTLMSWRIGPDT